MAFEIYQNAIAPETVSIVVESGDSGIDMTTISAASMKVQDEDGNEVTWTAALSGATTSQVTVTHTMPASLPSDVPDVGEYSVVCSLTLPSGTVRSRPARLVVRPYYGDPL